MNIQGFLRFVFEPCDISQSNFNNTGDVHAMYDYRSNQSVRQYPPINDKAVKESTKANSNSRHKDIIKSFERFFRAPAFWLLDGYASHRA